MFVVLIVCLVISIHPLSLFLLMCEILFLFVSLYCCVKGRLDNSPAYLNEGLIDLLVSVHQDVPFSMNIGFYSVLGNKRTAAFFARLLALLKEDPTLKDQRLFINLCRHPKVNLSSIIKDTQTHPRYVYQFNLNKKLAQIWIFFFALFSVTCKPPTLDGGRLVGWGRVWSDPSPFRSRSH
jgi:hypothetical protein